MSGLRQRNAYKTDLDVLQQDDPLDEQQQDEVIESLKSQNQTSNNQISYALKVLSGILSVLLALFALIQLQHHTLHAAMSFVSSLSIASTFFVFSGFNLLNPHAPIFTPKLYAAFALSLVPLASLAEDGDYHGSEYIKFIYLVPVVYQGLVVYMAYSVRDIAKGVGSLENLKYKLKAA
ncbi:hypothetical protein HDU81_002464 [Chytriomyces hyalinus]|nr:hypothetical protein HDU81_002464 [Chytriomyces hyalinus]